MNYPFSFNSLFIHRICTGGDFGFSAFISGVKAFRIRPTIPVVDT
jgi:hypothetical protein